MSHCTINILHSNDFKRVGFSETDWIQFLVFILLNIEHLIKICPEILVLFRDS